MFVARHCAIVCRLDYRTAINRMKKKSVLMCHSSPITTHTGGIPPEPKRIRFDFLGVLISVPLGIYIGTFISKTMANYLEENDLFVHLDDDDGDD